jgi:N-acetylneuraminate synthase
MKPIIVAEIGINHNGNLNIAKSLISMAKAFGADYVKFQKRDIDLVYTKEFLDSPLISFWGNTVRQQKNGREFNKEQYDEIDKYCCLNNIQWFSSVWDINSVDFISSYSPPFIKIPSACVLHKQLLRKVKNTNLPIILSRGMNTKENLDEAINILGDKLEYILHTTSSYPTPNTEMNMTAIKTLQNLYGDKYKIGFSNHCIDIIYTVQAYIMGANMLEFHITLDRNMDGTDQSSSVGPTGFKKIMDHINNIEKGWGNGNLDIQPSEIPIIKKLCVKSD